MNSEVSSLPSACSRSSLRMLTGTCARRVSAGSVAVAREQQVAQPAGAQREHDVVDGAAQARLDLLDVGEVQAHGGEVPRAAHRAVEARRAARRSPARARRARRRRGPVRASAADASPRRGRRGCRAGSGPGRARTARRRSRRRGRRGRLGCRRAFGGAASGVASSSRWPMSSEPTPSTRQWWVLVASAQRPPSRPSTSVISHRGRWRSRRCDQKSPSHSCSSASPPGAGSVA